MNNERLREDIFVVVQCDPTHPYADLLNRCYVALGEQQSVPEGWWQVIHDTLRNYSMTTLVDEEGYGYPLIDAMTADSQTVSGGIEECTYLADAIWNALLATDPAPVQSVPEPDIKTGRGYPAYSVEAVAQLEKKYGWALQELAALKAQPAQVQEPVGRIGASHGYKERFPIWYTPDGSEPPIGTKLYTTPQPSAGVVMPDWKGFSERLMDFITHAEVSSGVCCCGDYMQGHADPMASGHSPVDMWDGAVVELGREFARLNGKEVCRG